MDSLPVAYRPYQSKRHSRSGSSFSSPLSSPSFSTRSTTPANGFFLSTSPSRPVFYDDEPHDGAARLNGGASVVHEKAAVAEEPGVDGLPLAVPNGHLDPLPESPVRDIFVAAVPPAASTVMPDDATGPSPSSSKPTSASSTPAVSPPLTPSRPAIQNRPSSTFRHVPLRSTQPSTPSPLRTGGRPGGPPVTRSFIQQPPQQPTASSSSSSSTVVTRTDLSPVRSTSSPSVPTRIVGPPRTASIPLERTASEAPPPPAKDHTTSPQRPPIISINSAPVQRDPSLAHPPLLPPSSTPPPGPPPAPGPVPAPSHRPTPYRAGFQPKGVYRPRTDEFTVARNQQSDARKADDRRLERRLEKLIALHFPPEDAAPSMPRRSSSFFDIDIKAAKPGELLRGIVDSRTSGGAAEIRAAEQKIAPWQDDASVSACPLCTTPFQPLTNRKHHCRLCGRVVCGLPPKLPVRPTPCSVLIAADPKTGRIKEVQEGVAYGVTKRGEEGKVKPKEPEKSVRICRDCKGVVSRQQNRLEASKVPTINRLYDVLMQLEKEIEDSLPLFQEMVLGLAKGESPAVLHEAAAARKHLLDTFASYDAISKRIRGLPCLAGSAQERLQRAIFMRANGFLQRNMFPLQTLPKFKKHAKAASQSALPLSDSVDGSEEEYVDPDSELARTLQPLLEQEALLDGYVREATEGRKFEDARALKQSLEEIRAEIARLVREAGG